jgi:hypothetical protein
VRVTHALGIAGVGLCLAVPAPAALGDSNPHALWDAYPLKPGDAKTRAKVERAIARQGPIADRGAGGTGFPVIALLVVAGIVGGALVLRRVRPAAHRLLARAPEVHPSDAVAGWFERVPWPGEAEARWRSEIIWCSGYRTSRFRAVVIAPGRHRRRTLKRTCAYRWMFRWDPDPARAAFRVPFERLINDLMAEGWQPTKPGPKWWSARFVWNRPGAPV